MLQKLIHLLYKKKYDEKCSQECKPDYNTQKYLIEIGETMKNAPEIPEKSNIHIHHSSTPDIIVRHSIEMTLMSLVCNFGGLLGMWLGFSVFSISKDIFDSLHSLFRYNTININNFAINNFPNICNYPFNRNFKRNSNKTFLNQTTFPANQRILALVEID